MTTGKMKTTTIATWRERFLMDFDTHPQSAPHLCSRNTVNNRRRCYPNHARPILHLTQRNQDSCVLNLVDELPHYQTPPALCTLAHDASPR